MNPDKLFDYLDGKLSPNERAKLEERFMSDPEARQELAVARQIHAQMGDSREIVGIGDAEPISERGAVLARRIMSVFIVLVGLNVAFGIYAIFFMKNKQHARERAEQNRTELAQSLSQTAAIALPTPRLEVEEIKFIAPASDQQKLANIVIDEAKAVGGSAAKGLDNDQGVLIFAELPSSRVNDFREALSRLGGTEPTPPPTTGETMILQVRISSAQ
jgi:hypothetical protein